LKQEAAMLQCLNALEIPHIPNFVSIGEDESIKHLALATFPIGTKYGSPSNNSKAFGAIL
jgi:hypothetical protein